MFQIIYLFNQFVLDLQSFLYLYSEYGICEIDLSYPVSALGCVLSFNIIVIEWPLKLRHDQLFNVHLLQFFSELHSL